MKPPSFHLSSLQLDNIKRENHPGAKLESANDSEERVLVGNQPGPFLPFPNKDENVSATSLSKFSFASEEKLFRKF